MTCSTAVRAALAASRDLAMTGHMLINPDTVKTSFPDGKHQ
jgi:hypothetical protein